MSIRGVDSNIRGAGVLALLCLSACASADPDPAPEPTPQEVAAPVDDGYSHCSMQERVGGLFVELGETYPTIYGFVADGVVPFSVMDTELESGECALLTPPVLYCEPACAAGETCGLDGECIASPANQSQGPVQLLGLRGDVEMSPLAPTQVYSFNGTIPYPPFAPDDPIELYADRAGDGYSMIANGVDRLELLQTEMNLESGVSSTLLWGAPATEVDARVRVAVSIANHGGIPARIDCVAQDDGELTIDASLVTGLLDVGYSGFPSVTIARQSADTVDVDGGCAEFVVRSEVTLPVSIPGLTSCSGDDDCPDGQTCQPDLTCG